MTVVPPKITQKQLDELRELFKQAQYDPDFTIITSHPSPFMYIEWLSPWQVFENAVKKYHGS